MNLPFIHLRVHSEYSLVNGIVRIPALIQRAVAYGMPAVALTDQSNLFAAVKFYKKSLSQGVQPIIGADVWVADVSEQGQASSQTFSRLLLLCQNTQGYRNLCHLIARSYLEGQVKGVPIIQREWMNAARMEGLIGLSGGREGAIGKALLAQKSAEAHREVEYWKALLPQRFYIELARIGHNDDETYVLRAAEFAYQNHLPVVATNSVHFMEEGDFQAHETKTCIYEGRVLADPRRPKLYSPQQYLKSSAEMIELFKDIPEAIENTVCIARRCAFQFTLDEYALPQCPVPEGDTDETYLKKLAKEGLEKRLLSLFPDTKERADQQETYDKRLKRELGVINQMGFPGYFLIVADFVQWSKNNGVPVGPGRGSGAGSLVAYALFITNLDPIAYDLLFERFLNPERVSMPDFDIDFCMEDRDKVIRYVSDTYGRNHVSQIITYGSMAAKAVVRDVGRVQGLPYGLVDGLAKLIPFELGMTLDKALEMEPELMARYQEEEEVTELLDMAKSLEGLVRNAGKHAGGVVIAPKPLEEFVPLYCEQGSDSIVTQFDKDDVEAIGLVKFDFLGLRTLTIIKWALENIHKQDPAKAMLDIDVIPLDDPAVYRLLKAGFTTAVFQLESRGMQELQKRLRPDCFEDIVALVALFRPGPLQSGMVDDFIDRKHGAKIEYPHDVLEPILKPTYGVILYQEQVMQIAQDMAGYSLGGADLLRRAMGKKKAEEMATQREIFEKGAVACEIDAKIATHVFDLMEKFAGYGFNKSHSAAYAMLSYQTAWLKVNHPAAFMAAVLSADMDNTDKVVGMVDECKRLGIDILPPDMNRSDYRFTVEGGGVRYGLGAIKGIGQNIIDVLVDERRKKGDYRGLVDICQRMESARINKRAFESLIKAGALDSFGYGRAMTVRALEKAIKLGDQSKKDKLTGQNDLFGSAQQSLQDNPVHDIGMLAGKGEKEWSDKLRLQGEKDTLGLYISGHPLLIYKDEIELLVKTRIKELRSDPDKIVRVAGCILEVKTMITKKQDKIAFVTLDDSTGKIEASFFAKQFEKDKERLKKDTILVVEGKAAHDDFSGGLRLRVENSWSLDMARENQAKGIEVSVHEDEVNANTIIGIKEILNESKKGSCPVSVLYQHPLYSGTIQLGNAWNRAPIEDLIEKFMALEGASVQLLYR